MASNVRCIARQCQAMNSTCNAQWCRITLGANGEILRNASSNAVVGEVFCHRPKNFCVNGGAQLVATSALLKKRIVKGQFRSGHRANLVSKVFEK